MVFFKDRTYRLRDMELGALFRIVVVTNIIIQTILQLAYASCRVDR
jgi:hypothetical protein